MSTETLQIEKKTLVPQLRFSGFDGDWETNKLSDWKLKVIDGDRGTNYPNGDDFSTEGYCLFMNAKNVTKNGFSFETKMFITKEKDEKLRKGKLKRNDLILTTRGSVGNIAFYDDSIKFENLRINSGMVLIRNENSKIDSRFIYSSFFTPKLNRIIDTISFGSAQPQLTVKEINLFKFNIPTLPEQQKIASFLSAVDEKIQQLSRKKELLEQYKKGVMQQLFSGKLRFKDENGKDYPDWDYKVLDDVIDFVNGKGHEQNIDENGDFVVVNSKFVSTQGRVRKFCNTQISPLTKGDMVMVMSDVPNGKALAKCYLIEKDNVYTLNQRICGLKAKKDNLNEFMIYLLNRNKYYLSFDSGVGQTNLRKDEVLNCPLFIPTSIKEQQKIANFLSSIDVKIENTGQEIAQMQGFKKGLLQQLFV
ncbi:restriction endonuclease subunit S [Flavobacterium limnophilum]|uniref:restriction endonuclease subunit S n=1 Tax=Flavobacterium limnophilum TaxID=3003262 RepID=UPI00248271F4|nr:restriction endonuclease subunit S [Flavobacterium limnophilum]